jgi:chemotaxis response regulator CheB
MSSTKRVILADGSRLLREMLHRVIDKANHLEVVQELPSADELRSAINRFDPEWVILSRPFNRHAHDWIDSCMADYPSVRFIFLSPDQNHIKMKWQMSYEEDLPDLSLKEFIQILERDLQHI